MKITGAGAGTGMNAKRGIRRNTRRNPRCAFCGKREEEVRILVSGVEAFVCDACAFRNARILREQDGRLPPRWHERTPATIKRQLDERVVGQDLAKRIISVALHNHYKRIADLGHPEIELAKSNILLIGPSGTGKTLLARTLAEIADVPFATVDATSLTQAGYVGADVKSILLQLLQSAAYDVKAAEGGILYIDEIDKIAHKETVAGRRDVGGQGVQQALLRLLEGATISVPSRSSRRYGMRTAFPLNTANILFIGGGEFAGLESIVLAREQQASVGYLASLPARVGHSSAFNRATPEDLVALGFIPELVGRLPVIAPLEHLDEAALVKILTQPRNAIVDEYKLLFGLSGVDLQFDSDALQTIARHAFRRGSGARGLRSILERLLLDLMFALPSLPPVRKIVIDQASAERGRAWPLSSLEEAATAASVPASHAAQVAQPGRAPLP